MTDTSSAPRTPPGPSLTSDEARRRLGRLLAPRATKAQAAVAVLFVVLGLLITMAVRGNATDTFLATARPEDLVRVLDDLSARQTQLEAEARRLEVARDRLQAGSTGEALAEARTRADALAILAGTVPAAGPGVVVTIGDPSGQVDAAVLLDAVQELRDAGAEAIQINQRRVVADTWFGQQGDQLVVSGTPLAAPYVVTAIGDAATMATALEIPGGVADNVRTAGGTIKVDRRQRVVVDAVVPGPTPTG